MYLQIRLPPIETEGHSLKKKLSLLLYCCSSLVVSGASGDDDPMLFSVMPVIAFLADDERLTTRPQR